MRACVGEGWRRESAREEGEEVSEKKKKKKKREVEKKEGKRNEDAPRTLLSLGVPLLRTHRLAFFPQTRRGQHDRGKRASEGGNRDNAVSVEVEREPPSFASSFARERSFSRSTSTLFKATLLN